MNPIGIIQGRLSPPTRDRIQAFPASSWREEFPLAVQGGLQCIEWVYEACTEPDNPLGSAAGVAEIRQIARETGVAVLSVCADYYMAERLVGDDGTPRSGAVDHLRWLVGRAGALGVRHIVLPFVDASSLRSAAEVSGLLAVLRQVLPVAERAGVELHLETDLAPWDLGALLDRVSHPLVWLNYDIGNSASLGRDPEEEFRRIGRRLGSVHVKDRVLGGGTVPLGTGAADFPRCFRLIVASAFPGPFILQAARVAGMPEVELAIRNRKFVEDQLAAVAV